MAERLLVGFALLPVPIGLAAALVGKTAPAAAALAGTSAVTGGVSGGVSGGLAAGGKAGLIGQIIQALVAHPVAATIAAGALVAGAAVTVTTLPEPPAPSTGIAAAPTPAAPAPVQPSPAPPVTVKSSAPVVTSAAPPPATVALAPGRSVSLEFAGQPGSFVTIADGVGVLAPLGTGSADAARRQATFAVIAGLSNGTCFTFRWENGRYLRHASWRFRLDPDEGTALFRSDATFCIKPGATADSIRLEAENYPGWFLHPRGPQLWVDQTDNSAAFLAATSFRARPALAG